MQLFAVARKGLVKKSELNLNDNEGISESASLGKES